MPGRKKRRRILTCFQALPRNSFVESAVCAYVKGDNQKPQINQFGAFSEWNIENNIKPDFYIIMFKFISLNITNLGKYFK
jgi:hypothetical protein